MSKKTIFIAVFVVLILVLGGFIIFGGTSSAPSDNNSNQASEETNGNQNDKSNQSTEKSYTADEVAKHSSESDCWTIINNNVYDISSYIPQHPGGDEILQACGKDGTSLFTSRETSDGEQVGSGTPHSSTAEGQLETLKIGTLKQ